MKTAFIGLNDQERKFVEAQLFASENEVAFLPLPEVGSALPGGDYEALCVFVDFSVTADVLTTFPNVRFIATRSTGYDHIDMTACSARGITVSSVPSYGENTVAEHVFALLLTLSKRIYESYDRLREEGEFSYEGMRGFDLKGKTLGVVGTGRIGMWTIHIAKGFGMEVLAYDPKPNDAAARELAFTYVSLPELLSHSDIVTLHVPYSESTHHLLNRDTFALMKEGAYLINTSRGPIVETQALLAALESKRLAGAGLDVLEEEGVAKDELHFLLSGTKEKHDLKTVLANHILVDMDNVVVTPHNAFNTKEALERILQTTVDNLAAFKQGTPQNVVAL
jgi:D-lactate dehydrogenase